MSKILSAFIGGHKRFILTLPFLTLCAAATAASAVSYKGYSPDNAGYPDPTFRPSLLLVPFVCTTLLLAVFTAFCVTYKSDAPEDDLTPAQRYITRLMLSVYTAFLLMIFTAVPMLTFGYKNCFSGFESGRLAQLMLLCFVMLTGFSALFVFLSSVIGRTALSVTVCTAAAALLISVSEVQLHYLGQPELITTEHTTEEPVFSEEPGRFELRSETVTQDEPNPKYLGGTLESIVRCTYLLNPARCLRIAFDSSQYPTKARLGETVARLKDKTLSTAQQYPKRKLKADELEGSVSAILITLAEAAALSAVGVLIYRRRNSLQSA